ncbi:MAG: alpha/beta hydrolase [Pseudomonadota bacterium]
MQIKGFSDNSARFNDVEIAWSQGGNGPPVMLLHGFPQTRALWAEIAPILAQTHSVVCPDLRGYGESSKPRSVSDYTFRKMAQDQIDLMAHLGHERFAVVGHDRGARVAHRLALDAPEVLSKVAFLDIVPTHTLLEPLRKDIAQAYYHWFFLAQPEPFPETLIGHDPDAYFESCLLGWGGARLEDFKPDQLSAYRRSWRDPEAIRGMCNDYRAALAHDVEDDATDLTAKVACPAMVMYGASGVMGRLFDMTDVWTEKCASLEVISMPGGHFFPDTAPDQTTQVLVNFLQQ